MLAVISRQFHEMQRSRIEGLLASFPKLTSTGQQHTTVETEHVRFVYQPLDDLFMVLITNRQVNKRCCKTISKCIATKLAFVSLIV